MIEGWLLYEEPGEACGDGDQEESGGEAEPGVKLKEAEGDEALEDGVVKDVGSVGEVSPTGGADDVREDEAGSKGKGGDGEWAEEEPSSVKVQDVEESGGKHDPTAVALELGQVVVDESADEEEAELAGELDGDRLA